MPLSYVLINVELGSDEKVLNEVRKVPNVKERHRDLSQNGIFCQFDTILWSQHDAIQFDKRAISRDYGTGS
jgi:hypothetical protein